MTDSILQMRPYPLGAHCCADGIFVSFVSKEEKCGVILYNRKTGKRLCRISFGPEEKLGNIYYKWIPDVKASEISYQFYEEDRIFADPNAKMFVGRTIYGHKREDKDLRAGFLPVGFDWEGDRRPKIPYEDCIGYCMHVRGFTRHFSSGVTHQGTFLGIVEKLPYLKELGITTVELQPAYEFLELQNRVESKKQNSYSGHWESMVQEQSQEDPGKYTNYWGYKKGYYYAPKGGYAAGEEPSLEFKEMVKAFHKNGMEVIMQFYFPEDVPDREIPEILRFWAWEYHVDGFHLIGANLPIALVAEDHALADTKLWYFDFDADAVYGDDKTPKYRNMAQYRDDFMYDMRRFLKGDSNMLGSVLYHMRNNPAQKGCLNYITNYYGFTLMDLVSYDFKHNEANGEQNQDGNDSNQSWNCGVEGSSRKGRILRLRRKQIKNALCMLFFSQSTPLLFMGDEFGNSQKGNNNPYCQDNEVTWLNWKDLEKNRDLYEFTKELIALRKAHPILHQEKELRIMDYISCGYPDLSYHGEAAWRPSLEGNSHQVGLMYCGKYAETDQKKEDDFFYVALNMHWEPHIFAMPRLPKELRWELLLQTEELQEDGKSGRPEGISVPQKDTLSGKDVKDQWQTERVGARSVAVYVSRPDSSNHSKDKKQTRKGSRVQGNAAGALSASQMENYQIEGAEK